MEQNNLNFYRKLVRKQQAEIDMLRQVARNSCEVLAGSEDNYGVCKLIKQRTDEFLAKAATRLDGLVYRVPLDEFLAAMILPDRFLTDFEVDKLCAVIQALKDAPNNSRSTS